MGILKNYKEKRNAEEKKKILEELEASCRKDNQECWALLKETAKDLSIVGNLQVDKSKLEKTLESVKENLKELNENRIKYFQMPLILFYGGKMGDLAVFIPVWISVEEYRAGNNETIRAEIKKLYNNKEANRYVHLSLCEEYKLPTEEDSKEKFFSECGIGSDEFREMMTKKSSGK